MRILICDDEQQYLDILSAHVSEYMRNRYIDAAITATTSPRDVLQAGQSFDLAFLDIQMDSMDGISLAKVLRERNRKLALFFVTNYDEYQDDAMDLQAFRFFEKPFNVNRLYAGLDKAMEYIDGAYVDIFLSGDGGQQRVVVDDIFYVTRNARKVVLVTKDSNLFTNENYDALCEKLPPLFFYPVHKSYFVNLHYVQKYSYSELILTNSDRVPIAPASSLHSINSGLSICGGAEYAESTDFCCCIPDRDDDLVHFFLQRFRKAFFFWTLLGDWRDSIWRSLCWESFSG